MKSKEILETILKSFVRNPDDVKVERKVDEMGVLLEVEVNKDDKGLIIGRKGETIKAIQKVVRAVGLKNRERVAIKFKQNNV